MTRIDNLKSSILEVTELREYHRADLMTSPLRRGHSWYDARVNEVGRLTERLRVLQDALYAAELAQDDDVQTVDDSINQDLDMIEMMDDSIRESHAILSHADQTNTMTRIEELKTSMTYVKGRRDHHCDELMASPHRRGTAWYDDRVREVEALRKHLWTLDIALYAAEMAQPEPSEFTDADLTLAPIGDVVDDGDYLLI